MKDYVEALSDEVIEHYKIYLETFMVDLSSASGMIEFRVGFSLRVDHKRRSFTLKVGADEAITNRERQAIVDALFLEIEDHVDEAISANSAELN